MKLSSTTLVAIMAASLAEAAPAPADKTTSLSITKRETLENAVAELQQLKVARAKRADLDTELTTREYAIVTSVLTAIKDTELTPTILKFFVSNKTLKSAAITGTEYVIKSGLVSLKNLLSLLVQSGLITDVLNDILGNCEVYASLISVAKGLLSNLFKREDLGLEFDGDMSALKRDVQEIGASKRLVPYTHDEGFEMLRRDGMIQSDVLLDALERRDLDSRDTSDIVVNVLESLADSGLASQVVETVLTDEDFVSFGGALVKKLYSDGLISVSGLVSAVSQSGLLPALIKELVNFSTLSKIATTALSAFDGECSSAVSTNSTSTSGLGSILSSLTSLGDSDSSDTSDTSDSTATGTSLLGSLLSSLTSDDSKTSSTADSTSSSGSGILSLASSLLGGNLLSGLLGNSTSTTTTAVADACSTSTSLLRRDRIRIY